MRYGSDGHLGQTRGWRLVAAVSLLVTLGSLGVTVSLPLPATAATLLVVPGVGLPGTPITLTGAGFEPGSPVSFCFGGDNCSNLGRNNATIAGLAIVVTTIPEAAPGEYRVTATQAAKGDDCDDDEDDDDKKCTVVAATTVRVLGEETTTTTAPTTTTSSPTTTTAPTAPSTSPTTTSTTTPSSPTTTPSTTPPSTTTTTVATTTTAGDGEPSATTTTVRGPTTSTVPQDPTDDSTSTTTTLPTDDPTTTTTAPIGNGGTDIGIDFGDVPPLFSTGGAGGPLLAFTPTGPDIFGAPDPGLSPLAATFGSELRSEMSAPIAAPAGDSGERRSGFMVTVLAVLLYAAAAIGIKLRPWEPRR